MLASIFLAITFVPLAITYDDEFVYGDSYNSYTEKETQYNQFGGGNQYAQNDDAFQQQQYQNYETPQMDQQQQYQQMMQDTYYACTLLSRYIIYQENTTPQEIVKTFPQNDQQTVWKKIYAQHVKECISKITYEQVPQIFQEMQEKRFDIKDYVYLFTMVDYEQYRSPNFSLEFTQEEENIVQFIDQLEKQVQEQQQQQQEQKDEQMDEQIAARFFGQGKEKNDPRILGYSLEDIPYELKLGFLLLFSIGTIYVLVKGIQWIGKEIEGPRADKRKKKDKKDKKKK